LQKIVLTLKNQNHEAREENEEKNKNLACNELKLFESEISCSRSFVIFTAFVVKKTF